MRTPWQKLRTHKRGWISLWTLTCILLVSCAADLICNCRPLVVSYKGHLFFPIVRYYPETVFGGEFDLETDYRAPEFSQTLKSEKGWALWPLVPYSPSTILDDLPTSAPSHPTWKNILGTDDQARDVLTRLIYSLRTSLLFALVLCVCSSSLGIMAGAIQGYWGGTLDLIVQRVIEIWSGLPMLFVIMIISSLTSPSILWLLVIMITFSWTKMVPLVRAEFLRARTYTYVRAALVLGVPPRLVILRHILPNVMASSLSVFPSLINYSVSSLAALDFLGFGLPAGSTSLGELFQQAQANLHAPWLGLTAFFALATVLVLVNFVQEGLRDAFDPRT